MESLHPENVEPTTPPQTAADRPARRKTSLRRRALFGAAGLAGVAALTRLARAGELSPPPGPIMPTGSSIGALATKIAFTSAGIAEPRTPITSLPSSAEAQFVVSSPGAYYLPRNLTQEPGKVCIDILADHVDIDGQGFVFVGSGGSSSSCLRANGRQGLELYDCTFMSWQGPCCDFADCDDVYLSDVLFHGCAAGTDPATGTAATLVRGGDRCIVEDVALSLCSGRALQFQAMCILSDSSIADQSSQSSSACQLGEGGAIECCSFLRVTGDVVVTGGGSSVTECEFRQCNGTAVSTGPACLVEGCDCTGGSGGGIRCADGSCVEGCTIVNKDAFAIECGSRSSVSENQVVRCWGISVSAQCSCCDNDLSSCSGGPDTPERLGGAIVIHGAECTCESNWISSSRIGISVQLDGSSCLVNDNVVLGAGASSGAPGGPGAGIVVHDAATGVLCTCNHLRALPGTAPFIPGTSAFGPVVVVTSGDISALPGSSHPLANTVSG